MKELNYTSVGRIFAKLNRDLGIDDFSESDVVEWAAEALEAIDAVTMLEQCVVFKEVKNHSVDLPPYTNSIIQIARFNDIEDATYKELTPQTIVEEICVTAPIEDCRCDTAKYIPVDPYTGYPIFDQDVYEWQPNINVQAEYVNWTSSNFYKEKWTPIRLATNTFFNTIVCEEPAMEELYKTCTDEYNVIGNNTVRVSFQEGYVAISYNRQKLDDDNYPMIPDHFAYITAVTKYVTMKLMAREWYKGREGYERKMMKAEEDWNWYCKQAGNRAMMPQGIDAYQNMLDQGNYLLPRIHRYNQFFMDMSRPEKRKYNDPDSRNRHNN